MRLDGCANRADLSEPAARWAIRPSRPNVAGLRRALETGEAATGHGTIEFRALRGGGGRGLACGQVTGPGGFQFARGGGLRASTQRLRRAAGVHGGGRYSQAASSRSHSPGWRSVRRLQLRGRPSTSRTRRKRGPDGVKAPRNRRAEED